MRRSVWWLAVSAFVGGAVLVRAPALAGPITPLYLSESFMKITVVQGSGVINSWATPDVEASIAVNTTVRTYGQASANLGREYTLAGTATGVTFPNTVGCCFRDGTTDGLFNYAIQDVPAPDNLVWRFNSDWSNPQVMPLVITGGGLGGSFGIGQAEGIAYDPRDGSLWFALPGSFGLVFNVTMQGDLLALFPARDLDGGVALAFDSADNTLWVTTSVGSVGQDTLLRQFSALKTIDTLGTAHPVLDSLVLGNTRAFGAESVFRAPAAVPEPSTPALWLMAFLMLIALNRHGRSQKRTRDPR